MLPFTMVIKPEITESGIVWYIANEKKIENEMNIVSKKMKSLYLLWKNLC